VDAGGPNVGVGSTGTPGNGQMVSTGDAQLDRMQGIDIGAMRTQRLGAPTGGMPDPHGAAMPANAGAAGAASVGADGGANLGAGAPPPNGATAANGANPNAAPLGPNDKPVPVEQPVYKKWWFWAVVGVSAYVVYEIATQSSSPQTSARGRELPLNSTHAVPSIGPTLIHF
jgi:hypothetical protein